MTSGFARLLNEPVWLSNAARAVVALGVGFGLDVTSEQTALIIVAVDQVLAPILRAFVVPTQVAEDRMAEDRHPVTGKPNDQSGPQP